MQPQVITNVLNQVIGWEAPYLYWRWAIISAAATVAGRNYGLDYMGDVLYPNQYVVIVGTPSTKKSTVLRMVRKSLENSGYTSFSPDTMSEAGLCAAMLNGGGNVKYKTRSKSSKGFLSSFELDGHSESEGVDLDLDSMLVGSSNKNSELLILADEFADAFKQQNGNPIAILQQLWDTPPVLSTKQGLIENPVVNLLAATNPSRVGQVFKSLVELQGFLSRTLFVYAEKTNRNFSPFGVKFPEALSDELVTILKRIRTNSGHFKVEESAQRFLMSVHSKSLGIAIKDARFSYYRDRRSLHLLKIAMVCALLEGGTTVTKDNVLYANTLLAYTEASMPEAVGEFGINKNAPLISAIKAVLSSTQRGMSLRHISESVRHAAHTTTDVQLVLNLLATDGAIVKAPNSSVWMMVPSPANVWRQTDMICPEDIIEWGSNE